MSHADYKLEKIGLKHIPTFTACTLAQEIQANFLTVKKNSKLNIKEIDKTVNI